MVKCFLTGIEIHLSDSYVLQLGRARAVLKEIRQQVAALENIIEQLGPRDKVDFYCNKKNRFIQRREHRVVSKVMAESLNTVFPSARLLISWQEYIAKNNKKSR